MVHEITRRLQSASTAVLGFRPSPLFETDALTVSPIVMSRLVLLVTALLFVPVPSFAVDTPPSGAVDLALKQSQLADRYRQLESLLLKMAEYDSSNNPRRAALLRQALSNGKERRIGGQLDELVKLFQREQLQRAVDGQTAVQSDLKALLDLLLSEDRPDRLKNEQARVRNYIKKLDRLIRQQRSVQGRTEAREVGERISKDQGRIADQTEELGGEIDEAEGTSQQADQSSSSDISEPGNDDKSAKRDDAQAPENGATDQGEAEPRDDDSNDADAKSGPENNGEGSESSDSDSNGNKQEGGDSEEGAQKTGPPQQGQQGQPGSSGGESQDDGGRPDNAQQQQQFPGRKRIAAAEDRMREAQKRLDKAERDEALEQQEQAKRLLEQAKAELEEILRQMREEEIERVLALLEGRFRKMLEMELRVQDGTVRLSKTPAAKRNRQFTVKAGKLSLDQRKIILEVDKALTLLKEEGSSVAFPEAVDQMRADMQSVSRRLAEDKVGSLTQAIEADIISALEEMIVALQRAQQEAEERRQQSQQQQQQQQGDPADQPLVNQIAELKMIRALQMRVNTRTNRFAKMLTDVDDPIGQATDDDLLESLRELSGRQKRIYKVTSDIVLGKNK